MPSVAPVSACRTVPSRAQWYGNSGRPKAFCRGGLRHVTPLSVLARLPSTQLRRVIVSARSPVDSRLRASADTASQAAPVLDAQPAKPWITGQELHWIWAPALAAKALASLPTPAAGTVAAYLMMRWAAPAWALLGLLRQHAKSAPGVLGMLGRTAIASALYLYIVYIGRPHVPVIVSLPIPPVAGLDRLSAAAPMGLVRWALTNPSGTAQLQSLMARAAALLAALGSALFLGKMPLQALARQLAQGIVAAFQGAAGAMQHLPQQLTSWKPVTTPEGHLPASTVYTSPAHAYGLPRRLFKAAKGEAVEEPAAAPEAPGGSAPLPESKESEGAEGEESKRAEGTVMPQRLKHIHSLLVQLGRHSMEGMMVVPPSQLPQGDSSASATSFGSWLRHEVELLHKFHRMVSSRGSKSPQATESALAGTEQQQARLEEALSCLAQAAQEREQGSAAAEQSPSPGLVPLSWQQVKAQRLKTATVEGVAEETSEMEQMKARLKIIDDQLQQVKNRLVAGVRQPPPPPEVLQSSTPASSLKGWAWQEDILLRNWQLMVMLGIEGNAQALDSAVAGSLAQTMRLERALLWLTEGLSQARHDTIVMVKKAQLHHRLDSVAHLLQLVQCSFLNDSPRTVADMDLEAPPQEAVQELQGSPDAPVASFTACFKDWWQYEADMLSSWRQEAHTSDNLEVLEAALAGSLLQKERLERTLASLEEAKAKAEEAAEEAAEEQAAANTLWAEQQLGVEGKQAAEEQAAADHMQAEQQVEGQGGKPALPQGVAEEASEMEQIKARLSIIDDLLQQVKRGLRAGVSQPPPPPEVLQSSAPASSRLGWAWHELKLARKWRLMADLGSQGNAQALQSALAGSLLQQERLERALADMNEAPATADQAAEEQAAANTLWAEQQLEVQGEQAVSPGDVPMEEEPDTLSATEAAAVAEVAALLPQARDLTARLWDKLTGLEAWPRQHPHLRTSNPLVQGSSSEALRLSTWLSAHTSRLSVAQRTLYACSPADLPAMAAVYAEVQQQSAEVEEALECFQEQVEAGGGPAGDLVLALDRPALAAQLARQRAAASLLAATAEQHPRKAMEMILDDAETIHPTPPESSPAAEPELPAEEPEAEVEDPMFEQISAVLGRLEFRVSSGRRLNSSSRVVHLDGTVEKLSDWLLRCRGRLDEIRAGQAAAAGKLHVPHSSSPEALDALAALREEVTVAEATIDYRISEEAQTHYSGILPLEPLQLMAHLDRDLSFTEDEGTDMGMSVLEPHYDSLEDVSDYIRELVHEAVLHCKDVTHWLRHHFTAELLAAHPDYFATSKAFADAAGVSSWPLMTIPEAWDGKGGAGHLTIAELADREDQHLSQLARTISQASCHPDKSARAVAELRATHIRLGTARAVIRTWMHAESEFAGSLHCVPTTLYCLNNPGAGLEDFRERLLEEMCWDNLSFLPSQAWGMAQELTDRGQSIWLPGSFLPEHDGPINRLPEDKRHLSTTAEMEWLWSQHKEVAATTGVSVAEAFDDEYWEDEAAEEADDEAAEEDLEGEAESDDDWEAETTYDAEGNEIEARYGDEDPAMAEAEAANKVPDEIYDGAQESYGFEDEDEDEDEDDDVAEAIVAAEEHETEMSEPAAPGLAGADAASNEADLQAATLGSLQPLSAKLWEGEAADAAVPAVSDAASPPSSASSQTSAPDVTTGEAADMTTGAPRARLLPFVPAAERPDACDFGKFAAQVPAAPENAPNAALKLSGAAAAFKKRYPEWPATLKIPANFPGLKTVWSTAELKRLAPDMPVSDALRRAITSAKTAGSEVDSWDVSVEPAEVEVDVNVDFE